MSDTATTSHDQPDNARTPVISNAPADAEDTADTHTELVIALVGAVGSPLSKVVDILNSRLGQLGYNVQNIHVSTEVIALFDETVLEDGLPEGKRIRRLMDAGNSARRRCTNNAILALAGR